VKQPNNEEIGVVRKEKTTINWFRKLFGSEWKQRKLEKAMIPPEIPSISAEKIIETEIKTSQAPSGTAEELVAWAEKAIVEGRLKDGVELMRRALSDDPRVANRVYNIAFAFHNGAAGRNQAAGGNQLYYSAGLSELDSAIAVMELLTGPPHERADVWYLFGMFLDHRCEFERAIAAYKRAADLEPDSPDACDALGNLGILYFHRGRGELGITDSSSEKLRMYSTSNNPDYDMAEEAFLKVISVSAKAMARDPNCRNALINAHRLLREIYTERLQGTKAIEHCLQLHRISPDDKDAIQWLRQAEKNTGEKLL
jgi:tetratricopeptide (TPR) repeat protein